MAPGLRIVPAEFSNRYRCDVVEFMMGSPANRTDRRYWPWILTLVAILACLGAVLWSGLTRLDKGWLFPIRVGSGSMAPALIGPAVHVSCEDCRFPFAFDAQPQAVLDYICPNCGDIGESASCAACPGQRVTLRRIERPQRFDVVAARGREETIVITKRIVGLPGESIHIEAGDLFVDDRMVCKSPERLSEMAIVVHDDRYRVESDEQQSRWRTGPGQAAESGWRSTKTGYRWRDSNDELRALSWLTYHHAATYSKVSVRESASRLMDNCPYNQHTSRVLNRTSDCHLSVVTRHSGNGHIYFRRNGTDRDWIVDFDTQIGVATLREIPQASEETEKVLSTFNANLDDSDFVSGTLPPTNKFVFGYWDGHFHFVCNGRQLLEYELAIQGELAEVSNLFSLAARGHDTLDLKNLIVARDVYYTDAYGTSQPWSLSRTLQRDEFLLLGDNSSISSDARQAEVLGVIESASIIGRVIPRAN